MTVNWLSEVTILLWPILLLTTIGARVILPDQLGGKRVHDVTWLGHLIFAALMWPIAIYMVLSVQYKGDFEKVEFWAAIGTVLRHATTQLSSPAVATILAGYFAAGLAWAIVYFWLYARRLGQQYVLERDAWMQQHGLTSLEGLTPAMRKEFTVVVDKVKTRMFYCGDFPLRPLQQKRFFAANLTLWPVTLLCYLIGDMALDVARHIWFALRHWIRRYWVRGMAECLNDEALCQAVAANLAKAQKA